MQFELDELELGARVAIAMCVNCGDFVAMCGNDTCYNPNGGLYAKSRSFYLGNTYCVHLQEYYGHAVATWEDKGKDYEDEE